MKKIGLVLLAVLLFSTVGFSQTIPAFFEKCDLSDTNTSCNLRTEEGQGIGAHQTSVVINGTNSGSSVLLQYSDVSQTAGFSTLITLASTSSGESAVTNGTHRFWKLTLSAFTPTSVPASVTVTHKAYNFTPGTASIGSVTIDQSTPGTTNGVVLTAETTKVIGTVRNKYADGTDMLNTDIVPISLGAATTGGATPFKYTSVGSSEDEHQIKATAGTLYSLVVTNTAATVAYYRCSNLTAANTTPGSSTEILDLAIPGATTGAGFNVPIPAQGVAFSVALTCWIVTGKAESDATEVGADDVKVFAAYK